MVVSTFSCPSQRNREYWAALIYFYHLSFFWQHREMLMKLDFCFLPLLPTNLLLNLTPALDWRDYLKTNVWILTHRILENMIGILALSTYWVATIHHLIARLQMGHHLLHFHMGWDFLHLWADHLSQIDFF